MISMVLVNQGASSVPSEEEELRKEHRLLVKVRLAKKKIAEAARKAKHKLSPYIEKQLRRAKAVEEKLLEQQQKQQPQEQETHLEQENILKPLPVTEKHPEVVQQYEKAVLTPAIGWGMIRARLEKEAWKAKQEAKVEKTEVKLPPHMQEELGMKTVPSYKPNEAAVKAFTSSLAASGASFTQGFLEGLAVPLLPHRIAEGTAQLIKNPAGVLKKQAALIAANPLEASRLTGQIVGSYLAFKAIGKGIEKLTTRKVSYELIPEEEKVKLYVQGDEAVLKVETIGRAAKTSAKRGVQEINLYRSPYLRYLNINVARGTKRLMIRSVESFNVKAAHVSYDLIRKGFFRRKWYGLDIYAFKGDVAKQILEQLTCKPTSEATILSKPMKPLFTSAGSSSTASLNMLQMVKNLAVKKSTAKIITTTEPAIKSSTVGVLGSAATLLSKSSSKMKTPEEPKPLLGSKPKPGSKTGGSGESRTRGETASKTSTFSLEKEFEDMFKLKKLRSRNIIKLKPHKQLHSKPEAQAKTSGRQLLRFEKTLKQKVRSKPRQTLNEILKYEVKIATPTPLPSPKGKKKMVLPFGKTKLLKSGSERKGIKWWKRIWKGKLNILDIRKLRKGIGNIWIQALMAIFIVTTLWIVFGYVVYKLHASAAQNEIVQNTQGALDVLNALLQVWYVFPFIFIGGILLWAYYMSQRKEYGYE